MTRFLSRSLWSKLLLPGAAILGMAAMPAAGAILIHDDFDYTIGQNLAGQNGGTGFSGAWTQRGEEDPASYQIVAGLTFGELVTSGNAVLADWTTSPTFRVVGRTMTNGVADGETFWGSYLFHVASRGLSTDPNNAAGVIIRDTLVDGNRFNTYGMRSNRQPLVSVTGSSDGEFASSIDYDTTYLLVTKFTDINMGNQTATMWILTEADFASFIAAGQTEAALDLHNTTSATATFEGAIDFPAERFYSLIADRTASTYDEIRLGTTLASVTPIPEPASLALLALGGLAMLRRGRRVQQ